MPSANLDAAIAAAVDARIVNNGQSCIAAKRFIVAESIADQFERGFVDRMKQLKVGDPMDPQTELGPLSTSDAVTSLHAQVRKTIGAGARALTGGRPISPLTTLVAATSFAISTPVAIPMPSSM